MVFVLFLFIMAGVCLSTSNMQGVQAYIIFLYILYIYLYIYISKVAILGSPDE